jgi:uncharacterized membrane protein
MRRPRLKSALWQRGVGLEFDRVAAFNDAVFAIALTLLVLDLRLPHLHNANSVSDFVHALGEIVPDLISFAIAFSVIGQNWVRHHRFYAGLGAVDSRFLGLNVLYLGCIALVPFPTSVISQYSDNPMSFTLFAVVLSAVAAADALLVSYAQRRGLLREPGTPAQERFAMGESLSPIVLFLGTIPLAFLIDPVPTIVLWLPLSVLLRWLLARVLGPVHGDRLTTNH